MKELEVKDLHASIEGVEVLKGVSLEVGKGEIVALMGPNGAGKSSLGNVLMGHPSYKVTSGSIIYKGEDITKMPTNERAKKGLFLSFQYPSEVPGVSMANFLRTAINSRRDKKNPIPVAEFIKQLKETMKALKIDESFMHRYLNDGFSGGEKKRAEILQMAMLHPEMAILDETDSGLDVDSLKIVAEGINKMMNPEIGDLTAVRGPVVGQLTPPPGVLLITHYQRILNYVKPARVYVLMNGKVAKSGGPELVHHIEAQGYEAMQQVKV